jgi:RNA polymerase sigma factor (sigma-70 family)
MAVGTRFWVERLFREHGSALEAFLYRRTGSHADAIELAQEAYLRMLQIKDMDAIRNPKAYMFSVAANLATEHGVRQGRARGTLDISDPVLEAELSHDPSFADQIDDADSTARVREVLAELPAKCRAAFYLQHGHGLSYEEIARHLGVSTHMVKKYLSQAMLHCRRRLGPACR